MSCGRFETPPRSSRSSARRRTRWTCSSRTTRGDAGSSGWSTGSGRRVSRRRRTGRPGGSSSGRSGTSWSDMSRILGAVSDRPFPPSLLLAFRVLAESGRTPRDFGCPQPDPKAGHPDGWGIACIGEGEEVYRRGALKATADPAYEEAAKAVGRLVNPPFLLLAHVRRSPKRDEIRTDFSHPFRRGGSSRRGFFAHDGAFEGFGGRNQQRDSIAFFDRILEKVGALQR